MTSALFVPVRRGRIANSLRLFTTPGGERIVAAFTSSARLRFALGVGHPWVRLARPALRALIRELEVDRVVVDPVAMPIRRHHGRSVA
ncbi:SAV_915 family protein [Streptosporangium saharense]|uniref:SAV_915 family protein n=1 Tax=Streptosporangium saharense TaxID=1706840 RepID=UPI003685C5E0